jgi:glycosyltransferase involved in cell wall biosynthesis
MAKVSILLPCYKPEIVHFKHALHTLLTQTFTDWNATILHQPSDKDVRFEIAKELEDQRITFVQSETLRNIGENWNAVYAYANSEYVQFLFHDDIWYENYLEESVKILDSHADVGFTAAYHDYQYEGAIDNKQMYEGVQNIRKSIAGKKHNGNEFLLWWLKRGLHPNVIGEPPFVMMRKSIMDRIGPFHENLPQFLDSEYWTKLLGVTNFYFIPESLGAFRIHEGAASAQNQRAGKGLTDRLQTIAQLSQNKNVDIKKTAKKTLDNVLPRMFRKYLDRKNDGKNVPGSKGTGMKEFALHHPLLVTKSIIYSWIFAKKYRTENEAFERGEVQN